MSEKHILEKLAEANPEAEIWWDSSPLVYGSWARGMVEKAPEEKRGMWSVERRCQKERSLRTCLLDHFARPGDDPFGGV